MVHEHAVEPVGAITQPHKGEVGKLLARRLALDHRDEVSDNLRGMMLLLAAEAILLEQGAAHTADYRYGGVSNNLIDDALAEAADHDGISHARNDGSRLSDILLARTGMQRAAIQEHGMAAKLGHGCFEAHTRTGRLLVEHHCKDNVLEQRKTNTLFFHLLEQQARIKQFVDLLYAPIAQTIHVHVVLMLHNRCSFFLVVRHLANTHSSNPFSWDSAVQTLQRSKADPQLPPHINVRNGPCRPYLLIHKGHYVVISLVI